MGHLSTKKWSKLRAAMDLMRHSDRKLTDIIYTDSNLLQTGEVIRNLPDDKILTEILTEISGKSGQNGSKSVKNGLVKTEPKNRLEPASLQGLVPKGSLKLWWRWRESNPRPAIFPIRRLRV